MWILSNCLDTHTKQRTLEPVNLTVPECSCVQPLDQASIGERLPRLEEQRLVNRLGRHAHIQIIQVLFLEFTANLLR
jgi:hypothetical protein